MELKSALALIEKYLETGRVISMNTQYGVGVGSKEDITIRPDVRYFSWKDDVRLFLAKHGFRDEAEIFGEADSVPLIASGFAYGDPQSPESVKLMSSVREELSKKLNILREVRKKLTDTSVKENNDERFLFYLSPTRGLFRTLHSGTETYPVHRSEYRFDILKNLKKDFQSTDVIAKAVGTTSQKLRAQIAGMKKQIEKHFDGIRGNHLIDGEQGSGYRLGEKIALKQRE